MEPIVRHLKDPRWWCNPQRDPGARGLHGRLEHHPFGVSAGWSPACDAISDPGPSVWDRSSRPVRVVRWLQGPWA